MGEGLMKSLSRKKKSESKLEMWQWQARYSWLKFAGATFKKLEGLCVDILKFFPIFFPVYALSFFTWYNYSMIQLFFSHRGPLSLVHFYNLPSPCFTISFCLCVLPIFITTPCATKRVTIASMMDAILNYNLLECMRCFQRKEPCCHCRKQCSLHQNAYAQYHWKYSPPPCSTSSPSQGRHTGHQQTGQDKQFPHQ